MGKRTGVISYNLNDTGRKFTGQPRKIDIDAAMRLFNGPAMQEAVRKGDIKGYVGHQFREKFGLNTPETVFVDGKQVTLEPAVRTIFIKCLPTGEIQHEQEFMDTASGRVAQRLWESKAYGFSSAIHAPEENGVRVPLGYFGMDVVSAPNYDSNRGYTVMLDSVGAGAFSQADTFLAENAALLDSVDMMIKESDAFAADISTRYVDQCRLNDELLEHNAKLLERLRKAGVETSMLDSAPLVMERGIAMDRGGDLLDSAKRFMETELPPLDEPAPKEDEAEKTKRDAITSSVKSVMSVVGSVVRGY
ncbi:hypothetical protein ACIPL1_27385 [Pseudomonas sp. NPDC090202]|uniref:hypothetical protein n=1 Tax=unclassified Pseudomonas TaxID=196821 RepID=UPI0037F68AFB